MKRFFALVLCLVMALSLIPAAAAEDIEIIEIPVGVGDLDDPQDEISIIDPEAAAEPEPEIEIAAEPEPETPAEPLAEGTVVETGTCGDNLTWTYYDNGLLKISGTGAMSDFSASSTPWIAYRSSISEVVVESGVTSIGEGAFYSSFGLTRATLPEGLLSIGYASFDYCTSLTEITIPSTVTQIKESAFVGDSALKTITFLGSAPSIHSSTFGNVTATVYYFDDGTWTDSVKQNYGGTLTWKANGGTCGDNLTWALDTNGKLTISGTGDMWDYTRSERPSWYDRAGEIRSVVLESGVTSVGAYAFDSSSSSGNYTLLASVSLPESVTHIGGSAFFYCFALKTVNLPESLTSIGDKAFESCRALTGIVIPSGITRIENYTFSSCEALSDVTLPDGLTYIGSDSFSACTSLTVIELPRNLETIGKNAFNQCTALRSIVLPDKIASLGDQAFYWCFNLSTITFLGSAPAIGNICFQGVTATVYYPEGYAGWTEEVMQQYGGTLTWESYTRLNITSQPQSASVPAGQSAVFTVEAEGTGTLTYQWQYRTGETASWKNCTGVGSKTTVLPIVGETFRDGYQYRCVVSNGVATVISDAATLTILTKPTITAQPKSVTSEPDKTVQFSITADGAKTYQWQYRSSSTGTWKDSALTGNRTRTLSVKATEARNGYQYRCKVTNTVGTEISNAATLTVMPLPTVTVQPKDLKAYVNTTAVFTVEATGAANYQWYYRTSGTGSWAKSSADGCTTATLTIAAESKRSGYQYRCKVTNAAGYVYSEAATLTVSLKPVITTQPKDRSVTAGETAKFTVKATGASSYQWQYRTSPSGTWKNSSSATTGYNKATLQVSATTARNGYQYRCKVKNASGTTYSSAATLSVTAPAKPTITTQPKSQTVSAGTTVTFTVKATGATSYQWYYRTSSTGTWTKCSAADATTATLSVEAKSYRSGYQYRCKVSNDAGYVYTNAVTLTVK